MLAVGVLVACGKSGGDVAAGSGTAAGGAGSAAAGSGGTAPAVTYTLRESYDPKLEVDVHVALPPGWHDNKLGGGSWVNFEGKWMAHLFIGLSCDGDCGTVASAKANIARSADENFAFVSSANHQPPLVATWVQRPTELSPNVWAWRFDAKSDTVHQEEHEAAVERILPGDPKRTLILDCHPKTDEREPNDMADRLYELCAKLKYEVRPIEPRGSGSAK